MKANSIFSYTLALAMILLSSTGCSTHMDQTAPMASDIVVRPAEVQLQPLSAQTSTGLTLVEKEYSTEELKQMDVTCIKVLSNSENITYNWRG